MKSKTTDIEATDLVPGAEVSLGTRTGVIVTVDADMRLGVLFGGDTFVIIRWRRVVITQRLSLGERHRRLMWYLYPANRADGVPEPRL